jgi:hypothetical protein
MYIPIYKDHYKIKFKCSLGTTIEEHKVSGIAVLLDCYKPLYILHVGHWRKLIAVHGQALEVSDEL